MKRGTTTVRLALLLAAFTALVGCSTSTLVQSSEVLPLAQRVVDYHDAHLDDGPAASDARAQSAALVAALSQEAVSQEFLRGVLLPVLTRYQAQVEADKSLSALERRIKLDDVAVLRRVAGFVPGHGARMESSRPS